MIKIEVTGNSLGELADKLIAIGNSLLASDNQRIADKAAREEARIENLDALILEIMPEVAEKAPVNPTPEEPASSGQTEASAPPAEEKPSASAELDFDLDVAPVVLRAVAAKGKPFVQDILSEFGSVRASQLDAALWPELITRLEAEIA